VGGKYIISIFTTLSLYIYIYIIYYIVSVYFCGRNRKKMKLLNVYILVVVFIGIINVIYAQHEYGKSVYGLRGAGTAITYFHGAQGHINSPDDHEKYITPENSEPVVGERGSQLTTIGAGSGSPESQKVEKPIKGSW
jgi:hypothetical protein